MIIQPCSHVCFLLDFVGLVLNSIVVRGVVKYYDREGGQIGISLLSNQSIK